MPISPRDGRGIQGYKLYLVNLNLKMRSSAIFLIKTWLTSSILSPLLIFSIRYYWIFFEYSSGKEFKHFLNYILAKAGKTILYALAVNFLLAIILFAAIYFLSKQTASIRYIKRCLTSLAVLFYLIIFLLAWFDRPEKHQDMFLRFYLAPILSYVLISVASIWFYSLKRWQIKSALNLSLSQTPPSNDV